MTLALTLDVEPSPVTLADIRDSTPLNARLIKQLPAGTSPADFVYNKLVSEGVIAHRQIRNLDQGKLAELEAQKAELIDGYTKGVFTLDDIAPKIVQLDDQIADLTKAIKRLQSELIPTTLTQEQINSIHEFAAKIRKGLTKADDNFEARRKIVELLRLTVVLLLSGGKKYTDVECVLGNQRLEVENGTAGQYCRQVKNQ